MLPKYTLLLGAGAIARTAYRSRTRLLTCAAALAALVTAAPPAIGATLQFTTGAALYERWDDENGDVGGLDALDAALRDGSMRAPDATLVLPQFGGLWGARDNYMGRVSGYFIPPSNGNYVFFVGSDDGSVLYLSTDSTPANKKLIARESSWSNQNQFTTSGGSSSLENKRSDQYPDTEWPTGGTITLQAGQKYYVEVLWDEGTGGDGADVTYKLEADPDPTNDAAGMKMKGSVIGVDLDPTGAAVNFAEQPKDAKADVDRTASFSAKATGTSAYGTTVTYQWQKAEPGSDTFVDIPGATSTIYRTAALKLTDNGAKFRVVATVPTLSVNSSVATLTVLQDSTPPKVAGAGALASQSGNTFDVGVAFNEKVDAASAGNVANYKLSAGTITAAKVYDSSPGVVLTATGLTVGSTYTVTAANVVDAFGNKMDSGEAEFTVSDMKWGVVGGNELAKGNGVLAVGENGFDLYSDSVAEWGTYDEATFVYEQITGDFDKKLRVEYQDNSSQWARAGLIVRDVTNFGVDRAAQEAGEAGRYQKVHVNPVGPTLTGPGTAGNAAWEGNRRLALGAATTSAGGSSGVTPQYPNAWVRLQRVGDLFTIYRSDDGVVWTQLGTTTFDEPMPAQVYVGPEFAPENGNITEEASRGTFVAKMRDYSDTFPPYSIGLNFGASQAGGSLTNTAIAGVPGVAQPEWNNLEGASGSAESVVANVNGTAETASVTVTWSSANLWSSSGAGEENNAFTGDQKTLMTGYLDTNNDSTSTVTVTNLPAKLTANGYDLYIYTLGGVASGRSGGYRVLDSTTGAVLMDWTHGTSPTNPSTFTQTPKSPDPASPGVGTYIQVHGLKASAITIEASTLDNHGGGGTERAPINAVQLVTPATKEPAAPAPEEDSLVDGLVAYWNFDGNLMDSIKDFNGTARGTNAIAFVDGKAGFGKAIQLDGTDQFVEITGGNEDELEFPGGSMSIAGWFKVGAFDTAWQALIAKGEGQNYRVARRDPGNSIAYAGGVGEGADDVPEVNDGNWHHFVAISDATTNQFGTALYLDGVKHGVNAAKPVLAQNSARLMIGENPEARNREWNGSIDDIAIWDRVLTEAEIGRLYAGGAGKALSTVEGISSALSLSITRSGTSVIISWAPTGGTLESTTALGANATWTAVGTDNPATITIGTGNVFYRVRK